MDTSREDLRMTARNHTRRPRPDEAACAAADAHPWTFEGLSALVRHVRDAHGLEVSGSRSEVEQSHDRARRAEGASRG